MASISESNGLWTLQFLDVDKRRRTVRLGRIDRQTAETIKGHVAHLLRCQRPPRPPDKSTDIWLSGLLDDPGQTWIFDRLAAVGLLRPRKGTGTAPAASAVTTLGGFLKQYIEGRAKLKPNTARNYEVTRRHLVGHFGADRPLSSITPGDADDWRENLMGAKKLSAATVSREVKRARQYFRAAVRKRLIPENPFSDLPTPAQVNKAREHFVDRQTTDAVLAACPNAEWRLIVALSRYGGLRCPSETLTLQLDDVDWANDRFTVHSPKTEHHPDGATRIVPLFPELRPHLEAVFDAAEPGTVHFINRYRDKNVNMRTQFERIIKRAGAEPWPRLFHNMRASRQTELSAEHPLHVVCYWLGNSEAIASKHYLTVREEDFAKAVTPGALHGALQSACSAQVSTGVVALHENEKTPGKTAFPGVSKYPLGESNPCCRTENPES